MINLYELNFLISGDVEDFKTVNQKIINYIAEEGGVLEQEIEPKRIKLAYPIKKKNEAYLSTLIFKLDSEKLQNLIKKTKEEKEILRHLVLKTKVSKKPEKIYKKEEKAQISEEVKIEEGKEEIKPVFHIKPKKEEKVELKEIDKKIEEILNE
ncbi:MAG TPA: 30S ribosomal protein S6 [Candidatus Pacearchaeota archaeon]|nr:30S ribosomal protein S6 [Candidatus Paceibacterota bacterium]HOK00497.1 30S ribosomal protein S6 [Candidatus Pacearchaeota archaeon]HOL90286.1 30S ribosomal protein S6 [Candidatus Pacearchaeota archaeon]HOW13124.1 30S ribosomal protein S6 [Candidatus Pacearchaeota archaeon]HPO68491.1 30S ribosomal protein S6 [Candidatus Pacearchaeota archaeon]